MSKGKRYTHEFKVEAVKQVTERGYSATAMTPHFWFCYQVITET